MSRSYTGVAQDYRTRRRQREQGVHLRLCLHRFRGLQPVLGLLLEIGFHMWKMKADRSVRGALKVTDKICVSSSKLAGDTMG